MKPNSVKLCPDTVRNFLENVLDRAWFHLLSSDPNSKKFGGWRGYIAHSVEDALEWIEKEQAKGYNVYYQYNTPSNKLSKKAKKSELKWLFGYHVDCDLPADIPRDSKRGRKWIADTIEALKHCDRIQGSPHIIMTGNGVQALWMFPEPIKATPEAQSAVEHVNRRLCAQFDGDNCHNIERVLRLPGTANFPSKTKLDAGRVPILSELVWVSLSDFVRTDFDGLPDVRASKVKQGSSAAYIDYSKKKYNGWKPYSFAELMKDQPDIKHRIRAVLDSSAEQKNRSRALYIFLQAAVDFLMRKEACAAEDLAGDEEIYIQLTDFVLEAEEADDTFAEMCGHFREHKYGCGKLGYDCQHVVADEAEAGKRANERTEERAKRKQESAALAAKPITEVAAHQARREFIAYVHHCMPIKEMPNAVYSGEKTAMRQLVTEANVREVLQAAKISIRWDVMLDQAVYDVSPEARGAARETGRPREYFHRACSGAHADSLSAAQESLVLDALAQFGLTARRDVPKLLEAIAKEHRFHPLEDYCAQAPWDGKPHIARVAACLNTDNPLVTRYMEVFFFQCIAAVLSLRKYLKHKTGEQLSSVAVLVGAQGIGKTTFWEKVTPAGFMSKGQTLKIGASREEDAKRECLSGLVCNMDEIGASFSRSEAEGFKNFLAARFDEFRTAYAHFATSKPRMTVFCGTSNELLLFDQTGSRRFLVLKVKDIDQAALAKIDLQQVYAEAWHRVMEDGEAWWLDAEEEKVRARLNEDHRAVTEEETAVSAYLGNVTQHHNEEWLTANQICELCGLRYAPQRWLAIKTLLLGEGYEYRDKVRRKHKPELRKVWSFPVLPERYELLTSHA